MICSTSIIFENFGHISGGIDQWTYSTPCNAEIHTTSAKNFKSSAIIHIESIGYGLLRDKIMAISIAYP